ncbi:MAG: Lrp/AsnC ligand binding domain-containing protein [Thermoprotei archaeon]
MERKAEVGIAYVFVKTEVGQEKKVLNEVKKASCVGEAFVLLGGYYDILVKVRYGTQKELKDTVVYQIRTNPHVLSTLTLISVN